MIRAVDLRKGRAIIHDQNIWIVHDCQHVAKGNKRSYMQARLKNLQSGQLIDVRFRVDESLQTPFLEERQYEYLYQDGDELVFMDLETFDQVYVGRDLLGEQAIYLKPNERLVCQVHEGRIVTVELPNVVELEVVDAPPVVKGATATAQMKEVILETGLRIRVPPFIESGTVVRVDTRTGQYVERAKG
ncbi:MAG: elongation factor P [Phycisphaerae bacterium]